jgi:hypothetical protein
MRNVKPMDAALFQPAWGQLATAIAANRRD